eukprot:NODE_8601_length_545_cov_1.241627_g8578_i0.p2 GENE.NODE_8601_length_545_cov_1.241627_g8578_i0~~NODE_8601_length_545_cov_1.241627_g8578_i0.p2  ORF type:complete len:140 (+),score=11.05 NODE_8601_length_545_cov_1.241627_g8578_i0:69-488(+)
MAEVEAHRGRIFEEQCIGSDIGDCTAGIADGEQSSFPSQRPDGLGCHVAADTVINKIDASTIGKFHHHIAEIFLPVIDDMIGTVATGRFAMRFSACNGNDRGTESLADLYRCHADGSGCAMNQQCLSPLQLGPSHQSTV